MGILAELKSSHCTQLTGKATNLWKRLVDGGKRKFDDFREKEGEGDSKRSGQIPVKSVPYKEEGCHGEEKKKGRIEPGKAQSQKR